MSIQKAIKAASEAARRRNPDAWDAHKLRQWHWKRGYSIKRIASMVGMSPLAISQHFKKLGIPIRLGTGSRTTPLEIKKEDLRRLYVDERMSMARIAEHYICSDNTIRSYLLKYGIKPRSPSEYNYRQRKYRSSLSKELNTKLNHTCSVCGWDKTTCDAHHMIKRAENGSDDEVILVCPNCHRMIHKGLLSAQDEEIVRALQKCKEALRNETPAPIDWGHKK